MKKIILIAFLILTLIAVSVYGAVLTDTDITGYLNVTGQGIFGDNVTADEFLGRLSCTQLYNGTDTDFCVDATGDGDGGGNTTAEIITAVNITAYFDIQARNASTVVNASYEYWLNGTLIDTFNSSYEYWLNDTLTKTFNSTYEYWLNTTLSSLNRDWSGLLDFRNLTLCDNNEILKISGGAWSCQADSTGAAEGVNYWQVDGSWMFPNETSGGQVDINVSILNASTEVITPKLTLDFGNLTDWDLNVAWTNQLDWGNISEAILSNSSYEYWLNTSLIDTVNSTYEYWLNATLISYAFNSSYEYWLNETLITPITDTNASTGNITAHANFTNMTVQGYVNASDWTDVIITEEQISDLLKVNSSYEYWLNTTLIDTFNTSYEYWLNATLISYAFNSSYEYWLNTTLSDLNQDWSGSLDIGNLSIIRDWDIGGYELRALTFESDVATGTAPFTIASTTKVANLNVDLLDGLTSLDFMPFNTTMENNLNMTLGNVTMYNGTKLHFGTERQFCMFYNTTLNALVSTNNCG